HPSSPDVDATATRRESAVATEDVATSAAVASRFKIIRLLGRGGEGSVDLVYDAVRGQDVALKRVGSPDAESLRRLKTEFRVLQQLSHPGLTRVFELGSDDSGLYFTMEAIDGATLACQALMSVERLGAVLPKILDALRYLHRQGVAHRDLKPSNIMLT